jgi:CRP/FNR family cyclic AMP-dependent transcriptional regulator
MSVSEKTLAKISYFTGLTSDELEEVTKYITHIKTIEKGQVLLLEGDHSEYMYFIISGAVKVYKRSENGKEQILNIATTGETLNDVSTFDGGECAMDMLAMTPVRLYAIKKEDMKILFEKCPRVALNVAGVLAAKVRRDSSLVEVLSFDLVISRLARLILKQSEAEGGLLPLFTQQDLAAMVGTSRVVVNRSLRAMEEKGAIRLERRRIVITDEQVLRDLLK